MRYLLMAALLLVGLIHLLPLSGVLGAAQLHTLYGIAVSEPNTLLLLRHRAVLFGMLGALCVAAAFVPALRLAALLGATASVASFLVLAADPIAPTPQIARVVVADWIALAALALGYVAWFRLRDQHHTRQ